jgi:exodeoxyribonuclease V beta subunit
VARFEALAREAPAGCVSVERSRLGLKKSWGGPVPEPSQLEAAVFDRSLDRGWRRTSYSDITAGTYDSRVASEPEESIITDEPATDTSVPATPEPADPAMRALSLLGEMPVGVQVGTFVHRALEGTDFAATDLDGAQGPDRSRAEPARG